MECRRPLFVLKRRLRLSDGSISQSTPLGRSFTATQLRAGLEVKYLAYTSLKAASRDVGQEAGGLDHLVKAYAAASRIAPTLRQLWSACAAMPSATARWRGLPGSGRR